MEDEDQGSMLIGVLLGFFLGCIGVVIAFVMKGRSTITGSFVGIGLQIVMSICLGVGLAVLQIALSNM